MAKYEVVIDFVDLQDGNFLYRAGDIFPRADAPKPTAERIAFLESDKNALGEPVIAMMPEPEQEEVSKKRTRSKKNA